ncbi:MAG: glycosyltransferase family 4 protein [Gammaproteobacteria bacterium]|nr:glycosyltransferase family 4 protein [Gammaproteobacteria bacterium]
MDSGDAGFAAPGNGPGSVPAAVPPVTAGSGFDPRSLRIALIGYRSNPYSGGQGIYIASLARALTDAGHRVDVISGPPWPDLDDDIRLVRIPSLDLYAVDNHVTALRPRHFRSATDLFEYFSMLTGGFPEPYTFGRRLVRWMLANGRDYDVIHDNQSLCSGLLTLQDRGFPVVATIHHPIQHDRDIALAHAQGWRHRLLIRRWHGFLRMQTRVVRRLERIVTVSAASRADIASAFGIDEAGIDVVHNGIDTVAFRPLPEIPRQENQLMTVASADQPLKGLAYLLEAMKLLEPEHPDLQLLVVGRPKEDGDTLRRVRSLGLEDRVRFVHGLTRQEIVEHYARATLAVVPSLYEGFGLPAGEAMACGVPVVSTRGGALAEVVGDAGELVPPGDAGALASAVSGLLGDPGRRRGLAARGRSRVLERFSWTVTAERMTDYYLAMLGQRADRAARGPARTAGPDS